MTTVVYTPAASADDADQRGDAGAFSSTNTSLRAYAHTTASSRYHVGVRFPGVAVPRGAIVLAAHFEPSTIAFDDPDVILYLHDHDDAPDFADVADEDVLSRTRTTASTVWDATNVGSGYVPSPDISAAVQEVVDRAGWASGQAMALVVISATDTITQLLFWSYDWGIPPKMSVTYMVRLGRAFSIRKPHRQPPHPPRGRRMGR